MIIHNLPELPDWSAMIRKDTFEKWCRDHGLPTVESLWPIDEDHLDATPSRRAISS